MKRIPPDGATARSRSLRANMTDAERKVWALLRSAFPKWCFRRQVPFHQYIADFASHRARLVLEIDGGRPGEASDAPRTAIIEADGYRVLRFWNNEVLPTHQTVTGHLAHAWHEASTPPNTPPP